MPAPAGGLAPFDVTSTAQTWVGEVDGIRVSTGAGSLERLGLEVASFDSRSALLVSDPGLMGAGHTTRARDALSRAGVAATVFTEVHENPSSEDVDRGAEAARECRADLLIALGGGSVLDCAKGVNFVLTNGGTIADYWGFGKADQPMLPMLAIPTTCGTGSEAQSYALISESGSGRKMACGDPKARFRTVILDPELTASAPRWLRSVSGIDALAHALESLVSTRATPESKELSQRAFGLLDGAFELILAEAPGLEPLGRMQLGAYLAGAAIEKSMLGAAHAAANPLTARHRITHGEAVALMLPHVIRFNAEAARAGYARLRPGGGFAGAEALATRLESLRRLGGLAERLQDRGVTRDTLAALARLATQEWTGTFNPRPVSEQDFLKLYESAYE